MFPPYAVAVSVVLALIPVSCWLGAGPEDLVTGFATGFAATVALIFVIKKIYEDIDQKRRAPAEVAALHNAILIYNDFRYLWINMANQLGLQEGEWYDRDFLSKIEGNVFLERRANSADVIPAAKRKDGTVKLVTITWGGVIDVVRARMKQNLDRAFSRYITYLDPGILVVLRYIEDGFFMGAWFDNEYKARSHFKGKEKPGRLFALLKTDIENFRDLKTQIDMAYDRIEEKVADRILTELMYGVRLKPGP